MSAVTLHATSQPHQRRTRLAPSPTGSLHLGNARTFLLTWALARSQGWEVLLRIEDLDAQRVKPGAVEETIAVLSWLGLEHDGVIVRQSDRMSGFRDALHQLAERGFIFRCERSRKEVRQALSAPHLNDAELAFPPSLRPSPLLSRVDGYAHNYRLLVAPGEEVVHDMLYGKRAFHPANEVGDFLIWTKLGVPSYQLAVVVDDLLQGVSDVVRGDDLLASAARQQLLYRALGATSPAWWHLPLVFDADGERLAKRHGDQSLAALRAAGVRPERVIGLLAAWCGFISERQELSLADFRALVTPDTLQTLVVRETGERPHRPPAPCVVHEESIQWLLAP